jgi:hypothetical protein
MLLEKKTIELGRGKDGTVLIDIDPTSDFVIFRVGNSGGIPVKKVDLWSACFIMADEKTQADLIPVRETEMVTYRRIHNVKLKKGLREGEILRVACEINVPEVIHENLAGNITKRREPGSILIPRA